MNDERTALTNEYQQWTKDEGLPPKSAYELIHHPTITSAQWFCLRDFITRWECIGMGSKTYGVTLSITNRKTIIVSARTEHEAEMIAKKQSQRWQEGEWEVVEVFDVDLAEE